VSSWFVWRSLATWAVEIPWVLLGLRALPKEDTGLSSAEAVLGAPIVLPNEFFKEEEIPVDTIKKSFVKSLDAPAFSLPRNSLSRQLPSELPADHLSARLVWVRCGGMVSLLHPLHAGHHPPRRSSCFQVGLVLRPTGFFTIAAGAAKNLCGNRFSPTPQGVFCMPQAGSSFAAST
jgi:hypothetical protein